MKAEFGFARRFVVLLGVGAVAIAFAIPPATAAPPGKEEVRKGLEKVGNFFFKVARKLEQPGLDREYTEREADVVYEVRRAEPPDPISTTRRTRSTEGTIEPGSRGIYSGRAATPRPGAGASGYQEDGGAFVPPNFQPRPQPRLYYGNGTASDGRSRLTIPVTPDGSRARPVPGAGFEPRPGSAEPPPSAASLQRANTDRERNPVEPVAEPSGQGEPVFAERVPGHPGFVYPPGVEHDLKNMIDVRDFAAGQKVKDPRNGRVFLVPPK